MGNVIALKQVSAPDGQGPHSRWLRTYSRILASAATCMLVAIAVFTIAVLAGGFLSSTLVSLTPGGAYLGSPPTDVGRIVAFASLPLKTKLAYAATLTLDFTPLLFLLFHLRALLRLYGRGIMFASANCRSIRYIGISFMIYAGAPFVGHQLVLLAGHGVDKSWFHIWEVQALLLGAMLLAIARVMEIARANELDSDGFV